MRLVWDEVGGWFANRLEQCLGREELGDLQKRFLILEAVFTWPGRLPRRPKEGPSLALSCLHNPPRAALARSILQMRPIASTREISSRAYT